MLDIILWVKCNEWMQKISHPKMMHSTPLVQSHLSVWRPRLAFDSRRSIEAAALVGSIAESINDRQNKATLHLTWSKRIAHRNTTFTTQWQEDDSSSASVSGASSTRACMSKTREDAFNTCIYIYIFFFCYEKPNVSQRVHDTRSFISPATLLRSLTVSHVAYTSKKKENNRNSSRESFSHRGHTSAATSCETSYPAHVCAGRSKI